MDPTLKPQVSCTIIYCCNCWKKSSDQNNTFYFLILIVKTIILHFDTCRTAGAIINYCWRVVSIVNLDKNRTHNISENKFDWLLIISFIIGVVTLKLPVLNKLGKQEVHAYHSSSNWTNWGVILLASKWWTIWHCCQGCEAKKKGWNVSVGGA